MDVHGYTVVDSIKLILDVPSHEYFKLYGTTTQRAAIFINVKYGRSPPLIALKSMMRSPTSGHRSLYSTTSRGLITWE